MQKEIEVKAKVNDLNIIKNKLLDLGCIFSEPIVQNDTIFTNFDDKDFTKFTNNKNFLRIRKTKDKIYFTLKRPQNNELDCIEKEVEINNNEQMRDILELLDYHEVVKVDKIRTKTKYNDMEICLDEVKNLGSFIEVEKIVEGDGYVVQEELFNFLESIGVKREDRVFNGYDTLMYVKGK